MNGFMPSHLSGLSGSGPNGRIRKRDVLAAADVQTAKPVVALQAAALSAAAGFEPLSSMRRQIAEAVTLSRKTIPSFVIDRWVETTAIDQARAAPMFGRRELLNRPPAPSQPSPIFCCWRSPIL